MMPERLTRTVAALLGPRLGTVHACAPNEFVLAALERMAAQDVGALLVLAEGGRLAGILSERDCARKLELQGRLARDTRVAEAMSAQVIYVTPAHTVGACMALMGAERIRHLPVLDGDRVQGVVSARDILEDVVASDARLIRSLAADRLVMTTSTGAY